jgi:hypothetical protein
MALFQRSLRSIPFELIEEIIVTTTLLGDTRAAATLSQTCRSFRALVYHQFHKHLWREMFLCVFDSPFLPRDVRNHGRAPPTRLNSSKRKSRSCSSEDIFPGRPSTSGVSEQNPLSNVLDLPRTPNYCLQTLRCQQFCRLSSASSLASSRQPRRSQLTHLSAWSHGPIHPTQHALTQYSPPPLPHGTHAPYPHSRLMQYHLISTYLGAQPAPCAHGMSNHIW